MRSKHFVIPTLLAVLSLFFISTSARAQEMGTIAGTVVSAEAQELLPGANLLIPRTLIGTITNPQGAYRLQVRPGTYKLRASFIGYETVVKDVTVSAGQTVTVNFELAQSAIEFGESLVAIGSRSDRTAVETPVPIDVFSNVEIRQSGQPELNQTLSYLAPSFNASHQTIADGTDHINPASLRGLGPDQVLVLINGKRRHTSALVHVNGTFGRGTVGVDLNAIPQSAIERIEVLRDGAAAQYGSDAIAGVVNIVLKSQTNNVEIEGSSGVTGEGDGETYKSSTNYGFRIGDRGFFNVAGEFLDRGRTNRAGAFTGRVYTSNPVEDERLIRERNFDRNSMIIGQAKAVVGHVFFNSSVPLGERGAEFYAFGGASFRNGIASGFYRFPISEAQVNRTIYPDGFLPEIHTQINDRSISAGVKGTFHDWIVDLSVTNGSNGFKFNIENSINASLSTDSPTSFDAGTLSFRQTTGNIDFWRAFDVNGTPVNVAFGGEFRVDNFEIQAGEEASYVFGGDTTSAGAPKVPGAQVFPGFQPSNEVDRFRHNIAAYADVEAELSDQVLVGVAGRFENYSDFGNKVTGKLTARYEPVNNFALRGAVSTGFRAPSLHQVWFNNVSTQFLLIGGELVPIQVLTSNNLSSVTKAFGIPALKAEDSFNISAGFTVQPINNLSITADYYRVTIDDRIVLSSRFTTTNAKVAQLLAPFPSVSEAQFFANGVDTETNGVDMVVAYGTRLGAGRLNLSGAANFTETKVDRINVPPQLVDPVLADIFFNREEKNRLEDALPRQKYSAQARYNIGRFSGLARATYFGEIQYRHPSDPANDETFGAKTVFDVDLALEVVKGVRVSAGAINLFNTFPDKQTKAANISSGRFIYSRRVTQFGMNGGFYYGRLQLNL
ncbi:TonB-dependent receptor [candidate division KSB1 bacterium]|nr:TonB-dependent receptor [candidate division KSB1 bacterium]